MSFTIGLTGGIASGKSAAGEFFAQLGVPVLDADQVSRAVVRPGSEGLTRLVAHFGPDILDASGGLDRPRMREKVFTNPAARQELEGILHPLMRAHMQQWRNDCQAAYCVLMVPLLVKMGWQDLVDRLLVIDANESAQLQRLMARDSISEELARSMLAAQDTREERLQAADDVISNTGSLDALGQWVAHCHAQYLAYASGRRSSIPNLRLPE